MTASFVQKSTISTSVLVMTLAAFTLVSPNSAQRVFTAAKFRFVLPS